MNIDLVVKVHYTLGSEKC